MSYYTKEDLERKIQFAAKKLDYEFNKIYPSHKLYTNIIILGDVLSINMRLHQYVKHQEMVFVNNHNIILNVIFDFPAFLYQVFLNELCSLLRHAERNRYYFSAHYEWQIPKIGIKLKKFLNNQHYEMVAKCI